MKTDSMKIVNDVVLLFVAQDKGLNQLSEKLLLALAHAEFDGADINVVWASIARTNNWADREAGLQGDKMPKTLQNYRSLSRKAIGLGVGHQFVSHADWKKAIRAAEKAEPDESAPKIESFDLNEVDLPDWIERATGIRSGMTAENLAAFDKYIHHHIEAFMQKKVK